MYKHQDIKTVHLEVTSHCNAKCPMCLRNVNGGKVNPQLPVRSLSLNEIKQIFSENFLAQLTRIYLCGNFGDPSMAPDTLPILELFRDRNPGLKLEIFTNGSARLPEWWSKLAKLGVEVHWGIDGIGNTNAIYRRNTDFERILENAKAFIASGGVAHWDFIVFRHNEHQLEEAKNLSLSMGFRSFRPKKTGRFFSNQKGQVKEQHAVLNDQGELEYYIESPVAPELRNSSLEREKELTARYGGFSRYLDQTNVSCKVAKEKSVYISSEGLVFPCCWTAIQLYPWYMEPRSSEIWTLIRGLPNELESISALKRNIFEIIEDDFFQKIIPEGWQKPAIKEGKIKVCARICGSEFNPFADQFSPIKAAQL